MSALRHLGSMRNTGKPAEEQFEAYWKQYGKRAHLYRFEDQHDLMAKNRGKKVKSGKKPCDYALTFNGKTSFVEIKSTHNKTAFPFGNISDGQVAFATKTTRAGGIYEVLVRHELTGNWYILPWPLIEATMDAGRQSLKWTELENNRFTALETL